MKASFALRALGVIQVATALFLVAGVLSFAGPCVHDDGSPITCAQASWGIIGMGVMLMGAALAHLVVEGRVARVVCSALCAFLALIVMLVPGPILPICPVETMHCQAVMKPFALACGGFVIALSVLSAIVALRSR